MNLSAYHPSFKALIQDTGSLTKNLRQLSGLPIAVELLAQKNKWACLEDANLLNVPLRQCIVERTVLLTCNNTPWVLAQTLLPKTLRRAHALYGLGERSLGDYLFKQPAITRSPFEWLTVDLHTIRALPAQPGLCLARRSCFDVRGHRIVVMEVFLPELTSLFE